VSRDIAAKTATLMAINTASTGAVLMAERTSGAGTAAPVLESGAVVCERATGAGNGAISSISASVS
jgi:hypothetical protein